MSNEFFEALSLLAREKGITPEMLVEKIQAALTIAIKKDYPNSENINFDINLKTGKFNVCLLKEVVSEFNENGTLDDPANQIHIDEAKNINEKLKPGDMCSISLDTKHFGRIAAGTAKQVIKQGIKEVERNQMIEQWGDLANELVSASVVKIDPKNGNAILDINKNEIPLFKSEQIPNEIISVGDIIKVFVSGISASDKRPTLKISRTHNDLVKRLFEIEIPEIYEGIVQIKSISREAGSRSKVAVYSTDKNVDAVGACIGPSRKRISKICEELSNEKIDVILYSENPAEFITQALKPADVVSVTIDEENPKICTVIVPDNQLSLAIGNKGQNAKLAARLTGFKIDIKPESGYFGE